MSPTRHQNLIGGTWQDPSTGAWFPNEDPSRRGSSLGDFPASGPQDARAAVDAAAAAFPRWSAVPLAERQAAVGRFLGLLRESREELASIVSRENGKTIREARAEVDSALAEGTGAWHQASRVLGHTLPLSAPNMSGWTQLHPLGVAAVITPWNFPLNTVCRKALPALLAGCTVVVKPASFTPWSGLHLAGLFQKAGFPAGAVGCVTGSGSALGNALIDDPRVRAVTFTGSTEVGKAIQRRAADRLVRTQLELGGKNAAIVMADADVNAAVAGVTTAGFACGGQWCTATSRILVHASLHDAFLEALCARSAAVRLGDPADEATEMGPVAGPDQHRRIQEAIGRAEREGARLAAGGASAPGLEDGYFIPPTVFDGVTPGMTLFREEVFGPVLAVTAFSTLEEALRLANDSAYGLSSAIFTRDIRAAFAYVEGIDAGLAHVNMHTGFKDPSLPFGGWKESGFGAPENDVTGFEFFLNRKAVYVAR
jgi:alpha-ketoglutaric semialdehyde dehydrogenase